VIFASKINVASKGKTLLCTNETNVYLQKTKAMPYYLTHIDLNNSKRAALSFEEGLVVSVTVGGVSEVPVSV
jgi:hypothetical protein